jgi:hypothetical protein
MSDQPGCPCSICEADAAIPNFVDQEVAENREIVLPKSASDLRTRIAAALRNADEGCPPWDGPVSYNVLADAVIAALGLCREGKESGTFTNEQGATYRIEGGHRYVTDWEADDE